jgi:ABC-2 type transport system ATP-binding protein
MIYIKDLKKHYKPGLESVIDIPELSLQNNIYWLKGINGSGKTTLIKLIAGLIPFQGQILVDGFNILKDRIKYRCIVNYAEAEPVYPDFLSGRDLINFYTETKKAPPYQVKSIIERLDIGNYINNKVGSYSSGMTKKLSLTLAFLGNSKLILLDEPLITLDQKAISSVIDIIADYHKSGTCFLMASHQEFDGCLSFSPAILALKDKRIF